ncbi:hypothetical protein ACWEV3_22920 [Saccharopolyspora sp. NPDC003752]
MSSEAAALPPIGTPDIISVETRVRRLRGTNRQHGAVDDQDVAVEYHGDPAQGDHEERSNALLADRSRSFN